jgi:predicted nucleotide-binding protein
MGYLMDLLDREILKYEKRGFEILQRRRVKSGLRIYLEKDLGRFSGFYGVYFYYVDGFASIQTIRDCIKDYLKFYENENFGEGDKGFLVCSEVDKKAFNALKKAKIEDNEIRKSLKLIIVERKIEKEKPRVQTRKKVFIVHGRNRLPALELKILLEEKYPIKAIILKNKPHGGMTLIEKLEKYSNVDYAFITLTPDDVGALKGERLKGRSRQNVIFEWGLFVGKIKRKNICILIKGEVEIPTDLKGIGYYKFKDNVEETFLGIDNEIREAGLI